MNRFGGGDDPHGRGGRPIIDPDLGRQFQYGYRNLIREYHDDVGRHIDCRGAVLLYGRVRAGLTRTQVAAYVGCAPSTIGRWERGDLWPPASARARLHRMLGAQTIEDGGL